MDSDPRGANNEIHPMFVSQQPYASVVEWSITTDCKSVALRASLVQIQPGALIIKTPLGVFILPGWI